MHTFPIELEAHNVFFVFWFFFFFAWQPKKQKQKQNKTKQNKKKKKKKTWQMASRKLDRQIWKISPSFNK